MLISDAQPAVSKQEEENQPCEVPSHSDQKNRRVETVPVLEHRVPTQLPCP